jgi:hypothetical protein
LTREEANEKISAASQQDFNMRNGFHMKDNNSKKNRWYGHITVIRLPAGHVVFGLPSISGANQKKKSTLRPLRLERSGR